MKIVLWDQHECRTDASIARMDPSSHISLMTMTISVRQDASTPGTEVQHRSVHSNDRWHGVLGPESVVTCTSLRRSQSPWTIGVPCRQCGVVPAVVSDTPSPPWTPRQSCSRLPDDAVHHGQKMNSHHHNHPRVFYIRPEGRIRYRDGAGNTVEENSSVFSLILMR